MGFGIAGNVGQIFRGNQADELEQQLVQQQLAQRIKEFEMSQQLQQQRMAQDDRQHRDSLDMQDRLRRDRSNVEGVETMQRDAALQETVARNTREADREAGETRAASNLAHLIPLVDRSKPEGRAEIAGQLARIDPKAAAQEALKPTPEEEDTRDRAMITHREREQARYAPPPRGGLGEMSSGAVQAAFRLQDDYARDSKPYTLMRDASQRVLAAKDDGPGDMSLIFAFMKILDPNSVVRETEYANAQNAAGVPDQIRNLYNKTMEGRRLNPTQRQQFQAQAQALFEKAHGNQAKVRQTYERRAAQFGLDPKMVLDEDDKVAAPPPPPPGGGGNADLIYDPKTKTFKKPGGQ